jgi:hypothetical protein
MRLSYNPELFFHVMMQTVGLRDNLGTLAVPSWRGAKTGSLIYIYGSLCSPTEEREREIP